MSELAEHERDVEKARAKLAADLAVLRSPQTFSDFKDDLKHDALDTKDAILGEVKSEVQTTVNGWVEDLKAKAAANPAAALAIGAGIAWRLATHPPIASSLVGIGLFSLLRTNASRPQNGYHPDYLETGKRRLKEQGAELVSKVTDFAGGAKETVSAKAADLADQTKGKVQQWTEGVGEAVGDLGSRVQAKADQISEAARRTSHDLQDQLKAGAAQTYSRADEMVDDAMAAGRNMVADDDTRNSLLLGVAGAAIAVAVGIACQKRITENI